jgi:hypothetical protein
MAFELERVLYETEDFLRRNLGSASAREAKKRKLRRKFEEGVRRVKRALFLFAGLLAALVAWSLFIDPIGFLTWIVAIPTAFLIAFVSLFWGSARRAEPPADVQGAPSIPLGELAVRAEEGLLDRRGELPGRALPAADAIMARLAELQQHLSALDPASMLAGDARRLIGQHLPRLIDSYLDLPSSARAAGSESSQRFTESLHIVANELDGLLETCCRDRQLSFDTHRRFIETRYKDDDGLRGE